MNKFVLGIDLGGTNLRLALIDEKNNIFKPINKSLANIKKNGVTDYILNSIFSYITKENEYIRAIGIGVPGIVQDESKIISCPNLPGLKGENLFRQLKKKYQIPVFIEKDVNMLMMAEMKKLNREFKNIIGVYIGTGVGCSIVINGQLYQGTRGFAGELGHIPFHHKEDHCNCGSIGCLELYTGGKKLQSIAQQFNTELEDVFISTGAIQKEIEIYIENISRGIASVINILDPGLLILGGGVINSQYFPFQKLKLLIKNYSRIENSGFNLSISRSRLTKYSGCKGASIYYNNFLRKRKYKN